MTAQCNNTPFLLQVARHYVNVQGIEDYCFVFPNRRSGQFFTHYLQQELVDIDMRDGLTAPHLMPCVTSINDLVAELTSTTAATDIEMMFALYDAYCAAMGENAQEFDKFIYWAQLIIGDFNDIDKSLADASEIYTNLSELHGLSTNYLSDEVVKKVKQIFGENLFTAFFDTSADADLWQQRREKKKEENDAQNNENNARVKQEFISLWNALGTIYDNYHKLLAAKEVMSPGKQLRQAAEYAADVPLRYTRLVFVGFGVLSAAEVKLFAHFKEEGKAEFWWDYAGVKSMLDKAQHDPGALLIDGYVKRFGAMPIDELNEMNPSIRVVAVPSTVGQAKRAFDEVALMPSDTPKNAIDTAIVLPDESLLVPLLHSVQGESSLNVTLGYPLRSSGIVSLMHIVARLHHQASKEKGQWTYYREDVNDILSHPLIKTFFTADALSLTAELARTNRFRVPAQEFEAMPFCDLFKPAMDSEQQGDERDQQASYLDNLLNFCNLLMGKMQLAEKDNPEEDERSEVEMPLQTAFLVMYIDVLNQLKSSLAECGQSLQRSSVFYLIDRLTASAIVPFTGEPLQGLQIMGLLETRSLDFKNVVVLSMNERIFPRRRSINSFIPNYIRRAHGMSTMEQQEAIVAFNFYRLLNRASHVSLIYDSSAQKMGSSEPSRYIAQLEKVYGKKLHHVELSPSIQTSSDIAIQVPNTNGELRKRFSCDLESQGCKYLSASAINKFINCPLQYYLHYVQHLSDDNEVSDFMDAGTFGTIIHDTLSDFYSNSKNGSVFTAGTIENFKKNHLEDLVVRNIKKTYLHMSDEELARDTQPLRGEAYMLIDTIKSYVGFVLDYDIKLINGKGPLQILECEETHELQLTMGDVTFNFTYKPDRIDRLEDGTIRIVDYKTGKDETVFSSGNELADLFEPTKDKRRKAILQLFLYCYAYLTEHPEVEKVQPVIYKLSSIEDSGVKHSFNRTKTQFEFSRNDDDVKKFVKQMELVIKRLYDDDFVQAVEDAPCCSYCRFIDFCRRTPQKGW